MNTQINNKWYDRLKWVAQILLPAVATLYIALGALYTNFPDSTTVVGTIVAVDAFLGVLLGISTKQYEQNPDVLAGNLHVVTDNNDGQTYASAAFAKPPENFTDGDIVRMRVKKRSS